MQHQFCDHCEGCRPAKTVMALTQGKALIGRDFLIISNDGTCVVRDIYGLTKWIEAKGLKRI